MTRSRTTMARLAMRSALGLLLVPALALALMVPFSLDRLVAEADTIVRGTVVGIDSHWDDAGRLIVTDVTLEVAETLKGIPSPRRVLRVTGGTVDDVTLTTSNDPTFEAGESVIAFLDTGAVPATLVGLWQGKLTVEDGTVDRAGRRIPVAELTAEIQRSLR